MLVAAVSLARPAGAQDSTGPAAEATSAEPPTETPSPEPRRPAPKVAVVVAGDPDDTLRGTAARIARVVADAEGLRGPSDPGLVRALRGEPGAEDDGLDRVRRDRRRLGLGDDDDAPLLLRLGRMTGAAVVVVVRGADEGASLEVFDVNAQAFYEGGLSLPADDAHVQGFITSRARAARRRASAEAVAVTTAAEADQQAEGEAGEHGGQGAEHTGGTPQAEERPGFFRRNWAYILAGVAVAGAATVLVVTRGDDASPPPVLRFRPGGSS
jgi:hypothetical protein